jgi:effector-binding domain-containing protein
MEVRSNIMSYKIYILIAAVLIGAAFFAWQIFGYKTPEPKYTIVKAEGPIQIRSYPEILVAEVSVQGERYVAINNGFRILADFIFGNNSGKQKITMTAPVIQQGAKIAMTAPVIQQQAGDGWVVRFVMPDTYTKDTLPKPNNPDIAIITVPATEYAAVTFSGRNTDSNIQDHLQILLNYINEHHLKAVGNPIMAFYNPPWIMPFLRRNEIMLELRK